MQGKAAVVVSSKIKQNESGGAMAQGTCFTHRTSEADLGAECRRVVGVKKGPSEQLSSQGD